MPIMPILSTSLLNVNPFVFFTTIENIYKEHLW